MGANMARRLVRGGHRCMVFDRSAAVDSTITDLASLLEADDIVIDGGTSYLSAMRLGFGGHVEKAASPTATSPTATSTAAAR
jgi:6-phosphogluconate dehydrogenase (decarboxylating)